jgi:hypothetical protein
MRKLIYIASYIAGLTLVLSGGLNYAEAKDKSHKHSEESSITYRRSERESGGDSTKSRYGFGFSTYSLPIPGTSTAAMSGSIGLDNLNMIQVHLAIPGTSPGFNIGGSVFLKHTCYDVKGAGFHFGAGVGVADVNAGGNTGAHLELSFSAIGGVHFEVPGTSNLMVYLDGGPTFYLINTDPSRSSFMLAPLSSALGASILYHY